MTIDDRLSRLERQNGLLKGAALLALAAAGLALALAHRPPNLISDLDVKSLTLKDDAGNTRIALRLESGTPCLKLWDMDGRERVNLCAARNSGIWLMDSESQERLRLFVDQNGMPVLLVSDSAAVPRLALQSMPDGSPLLRMWDASKRQRIALGLVDHIPMLTITDTSGTQRLALREPGTNADLSVDSALTLRRADGSVLWCAPK